MTFYSGNPGKCSRCGFEWHDWNYSKAPAGETPSHHCVLPPPSCAELMAEVERLKTALEFYADRENWRRWYSKEGEEFRQFPTDTSIDQGNRAREALGAGHREGE